jgi:hypothetical protein
MAYVAGFEHDIFISYAWVDNQPDDGDDPERGWVSQFRYLLNRRVDQKLGRIGAAHVFFDTTQLGKNRDFGPQIEAAVRNAATLVVLFSNGYLKSEACREELRLFHGAVGQKLSASGRLFVVRLDNVPAAAWPDDVRGAFGNQLLGYQWYHQALGSDLCRILNASDDEYQNQLERLRSDLFVQLETMSGTLAVPRVDHRIVKAKTSDTVTCRDIESDIPDVPTVLVAQSTPDLRRARQDLIAYCENAGYDASIKFRVLGKGPYPAAPGEFRETFACDQRQAHLFVQILGEAYSDRTPEFPEGIEIWQLAEARKCKLPTVQWCSGNVLANDVDDENHRRLLSDPDVLHDLPAGFHATVVEHARRAYKLHNVTRDEEPERLVIVKYCDADAEVAREVVETLGRHNVTCLSSNNGLSIVDTLREIPAQALLIVLGDCPQEWLTTRGLELLKVQFTFKDRSPLQIYFDAHSKGRIPPLTGKGILEFHGRGDLDRLVSAIWQRGRG